MQRTLVLIKPDGMRNLTAYHDIVTTIENTNLKIIEYKQLIPEIESAREHYAEHEGKPFFDRITEALTTGVISVLIVQGPDAINQMRAKIGSKDDPSTLRGKYTNPEISHENAIHGSDSIESAEREISIWFK